MENKNIELVKELTPSSNLWQDFLLDILKVVMFEFYGKVFSGLIPGGEEIKGKEELTKMFGLMPEYVDMKKFEPVDWCGVGNNVYFTVNWEFIWKPTQNS